MSSDLQSLTANYDIKFDFNQLFRDIKYFSFFSSFSDEKYDTLFCALLTQIITHVVKLSPFKPNINCFDVAEKLQKKIKKISSNINLILCEIEFTDKIFFYYLNVSINIINQIVQKISKNIIHCMNIFNEIYNEKYSLHFRSLSEYSVMDTFFSKDKQYLEYFNTVINMLTQIFELFGVLFLETNNYMHYKICPQFMKMYVSKICTPLKGSSFHTSVTDGRIVKHQK
jgi:hypothetical protein